MTECDRLDAWIDVRPYRAPAASSIRTISA